MNKEHKERKTGALPDTLKKTALHSFLKIVKIIVSITVILAAFFVSAGTIFWVEAWLFLLFYFLSVIIGILWLKKHDPELLKERATKKKQGKRWDKILLSFYSLFLILMIITCGLDSVRFQWIKVHYIIKIAGFLGFLPGIIIIFKVYKENTFASEVVRIQNDREHHVIKTGPYRYVRHPMYSAIMILVLCLPLALGSFLALFFSVLIIIVFFIRTSLEDRTLQNELPGYKVYTREVKYRLIPGIW
ncbi:MAG: isoprenylcysteine carboxylmethyltransferase family protein [Spirochaetales bacterium]|nr:isoprenylcysteine carboxylmethyltransferase family protein [Spirochaetales bacterium]